MSTNTRFGIYYNTYNILLVYTEKNLKFINKTKRTFTYTVVS